MLNVLYVKLKDNKFVAIFFFQAEDGIRDLVRSRGLGDVYKRQSLAKSPTRTVRTQSNHVFMTICAVFKLECLSIKTVSYTHLTLPTSDLV